VRRGERPHPFGADATANAALVAPPSALRGYTTYLPQISSRCSFYLRQIQTRLIHDRLLMPFASAADPRLIHRRYI
jgi:hypothetical protein